MLRYSVSISAIPTYRGLGTYNVSATVCAYEDEECVIAIPIWDKRTTDMPEIHSTLDVTEFVAEWSDCFYQIASEMMANVKRRDEEVINARPSSASTN
jgi:hypothetical protein